MQSIISPGVFYTPPSDGALTASTAGLGFNYKCEHFKGLGLYDPKTGDEFPILHPRHEGDGLRIIYGEKLDEWMQPNIIPNVGLAYITGSAFYGTTQITNQFLGLYTAAYDCVAGDTFATFLASATETSAYTSATRVAYTKDALTAAGAMNNSGTPAEFTFNAGVTVTGAFLSSQSTKASSTGTLFSAARFAASKTMASGEILRVTAPLTPTTT